MFFLADRKKRLAMLDLLIAEQREGRIDDEGIQEELDTFTFEVSDMIFFFLLLSTKFGLFLLIDAIIL